MYTKKSRHFLEADRSIAVFTVADLLQHFLCVVVSGGGFSEENRESFLKGAAAVLRVDRTRVERFNLGDMSQLSPAHIEGLDRALFGQTGFTAYAAGCVSKELKRRRRGRR